MAGREVVIRLVVRRFRCLESGCPRRIFSEQVTDGVGRHQRRCPLLAEFFTRVGPVVGQLVEVGVDDWAFRRGLPDPDTAASNPTWSRRSLTSTR